MNDPREPNRGSEPPQELASLPVETTPPAHLEDRVVDALASRHLLRRKPALWSGPFARAAAVIMLLGAGFVAGRLAAPGTPTSDPLAGGGPAGSRYALLLYETEDYRTASGEEEITRYHEYSKWVAWAREREQFVTGEDLAVDEGRVLSPGDGSQAEVAPGVTPSSSASLSGVFLVEANDLDHAVEVARRLPHLGHGGQVVVQQVLPTDRPPDADRG